MGKHRGRGSLTELVMLKLQKNRCQQAAKRTDWRKGKKWIFFFFFFFFSHMLFDKFKFTSYRPNSVFWFLLRCRRGYIFIRDHDHSCLGNVLFIRSSGCKVVVSRHSDWRFPLKQHEKVFIFWSPFPFADSFLPLNVLESGERAQNCDRQLLLLGM